MKFELSFLKILSFILFFILIYIEPIEFLGFKFSQIWKGVLVLFIFFKLIKYPMPYFYWFGILFSFKYLFYSSFPYGFFDNLRLCLENLIFPLSLGYLIKFYSNKKSNAHIINILILSCLFFIYSSVPFLFGLKSLYSDFDLSLKYNLFFAAPKGLFYHIATASKVYTISTIIIILYRKLFFHNIFYKFFYGFTVLLGTFNIIMCWTRTAWFIYFGCLLLILFYKTNIKVRIFGFFVSFITVSILIFIYNTVPAFRWRLTGGASYRVERDFSFEELANSRFPYIVTAIDNMKDQGFLFSTVGYGETLGKDLFEKKLNMAITSHNATFEILESNGIIGLALYLMFIGSLINYILCNINSLDHFHKKLIVISCFLYFSFFFISHGTPLWGELMFSLILVYILSKFESTTHN